MVKPVKTVDGRTCTVCGKGATGPWEQYMEPRCDEHKMGTVTGRRMFWRLGEDERARRGLGLPIPSERQAKILASEDAKLAGTGVSRADYGSLELRVLAHSMEQLAGHIAYEMSRITVMDVPTARALVDATVRVLTTKGPLTPDDLRYQPPLMTATEINALPRKAREYIHQLVANTDPTGMVRENMQLIDTNKGLQTMYLNRTDEVDKLKAVLERVKTGMEWTRCELPTCWNSVDDEMLAEINEVLK